MSADEANTVVERGRRWGRICSPPSAYVIKLRGGRVVRHGPGLSLFVWPWETYTLLPTTIQRVSFCADQVTAEKVGVEVRGMAVYRIAEPLLAFRLVDFSGEDSGPRMLAETMEQMFTGAVRRLVANMGIEQCLTRRKEQIAQELMGEIQPVVSGQGRPDDATDRGWGVVIDTIEIQDVRILSERVFRDLQAPFRTALRADAQQHELQQEQSLHLRQVEAARARLEADQQLQQRKASLAEEAELQALACLERREQAEVAAQEGTARVRLQAALAAEERQRQLDQAEAQTRRLRGDDQAATARLRAAQEASLAEQRQQADDALQRLRAEAQRELAEIAAEAQALAARHGLQTARLPGELLADLRRRERVVDSLFSEQRLRPDLLTHTLPAAARAVAEALGPVHLTRIEGGAGGDGPPGLAGALAQILAVIRSAGVDLGAILAPRAGGGDAGAGPREGDGGATDTAPLP